MPARASSTDSACDRADACRTGSRSAPRPLLPRASRRRPFARRARARRSERGRRSRPPGATSPPRHLQSRRSAERVEDGQLPCGGVEVVGAPGGLARATRRHDPLGLAGGGGEVAGLVEPLVGGRPVAAPERDGPGHDEGGYAADRRGVRVPDHLLGELRRCRIPALLEHRAPPATRACRGARRRGRARSSRRSRRAGPGRRRPAAGCGPDRLRGSCRPGRRARGGRRRRRCRGSGAAGRCPRAGRRRRAGPYRCCSARALDVSVADGPRQLDRPASPSRGSPARPRAWPAAPCCSTPWPARVLLRAVRGSRRRGRRTARPRHRDPGTRAAATSSAARRRPPPTPGRRLRVELERPRRAARAASGSLVR